MTSPTHGRLHALDNLRGLMMWLGIVMHVAAIHVTHISLLPWRDNQTAPWVDGLAIVIHAFRMPVFFILAGFFVALLVQKRGIGAMLKNRLKRLGLPFAIFWLPVFVLTVVFALLFIHRMVRGTWGIDPTLMPRSPTVPTGPSTMHLWFLWMLLWFSVLTAAILRLTAWVPPALPQAIASLFHRLGAAWWGFAALALPLALVGSLYWNGIVAPSGKFIPPPAEWLHNGLFYLFGYCVYSRQQELFAVFIRRWPAYAVLGALFVAVAGVLAEQLGQVPRPGSTLPLWIALTYNCATWLWSFALIGAFLRYLPGQQALLTYLAQSSYWVYLVHMPLTVGFGALLYGLDWPVAAKMLVNIGATTLLCLGSYQLFVRGTVVSVLLNGRRFSPTPSGAPAHATPH